MKLTPEGKKVWYQPFHPVDITGQVVKLAEYGCKTNEIESLFPQISKLSGITYGDWLVGPALGSVIQYKAIRSEEFVHEGLTSQEAYARAAIEFAIATCNELGKMEVEG